MELERIQVMLKEYKACLGRCNHLKTEMSVIEKQIESIKRDTVETLASPKPKVISDMPRGTQLSNPTEKYGGMLADGYKTDEQVILEAKLSEYQAEYDDKIATVDYVNSWMSGLADREKVVIRSNMVDGESWRDTVNTYNQKFGEMVSKDTLKRIKDKAMDKICEMAK